MGPQTFADKSSIPDPTDAAEASSVPPRERSLEWNGRELRLGARALVMGVVNCTPDSFFPGSRTEGRDAAIERGLEMVAAGADILDIGGESTRPGSDPVGPAVELERVIPVIEGLQGRVQVPLSIDTRDAAVADAALEAGAELLNDISALLGDPRMGEVAARRGVPVVLMHMRGEPKTMQEAPYYRDTIGEVQAELQAAVDRALGAGIRRERIILDPGIGFGKRLQDNLRLLGRLECLRALGCPLLVGVSRKSFIGRVLDLPVEERLIGTVAANTIAVLNGADILRVHDVAAAVQVVRMVEAVRQASVREGA